MQQTPAPTRRSIFRRGVFAAAPLAGLALTFLICPSGAYAATTPTVPPTTVANSPHYLLAPAASSGYYQQNIGSGLCMTDMGQGAGYPVAQYTCNGSINQQWNFIGSNQIQNVGDGQCIDNYGDQFVDGNIQYLEPCVGANNEQYHEVAAYGNNYYQIGIVGSPGGTGYCLTSGGNTSNGSSIFEYTCNSSYNQAWSSPGV